MSKSKSKTFHMRTGIHEIKDWMERVIDCQPETDHAYHYSEVTTAKYLITITKYPEKEFSEKGREKE